MARIYYVGDWAVMMGPIFAESTFYYEYKGVEIFNDGKWLVDALQAAGHEVRSVPAWDFYKIAPGEFDDVLSRYDVFIFSDVEERNFQLHPSFFDRSKFGEQSLTFPDRARLTVEAVRAPVNPRSFSGVGSVSPANAAKGDGDARAWLRSCRSSASTSRTFARARRAFA